MEFEAFYCIIKNIDLHDLALKAYLPTGTLSTFSSDNKSFMSNLGFARNKGSSRNDSECMVIRE